MDKKSIAEVMRSLASGEKNRSLIARLREVFDSVETAISAGVTRAAILEALHGQGLTMTPKTFSTAIHRIREERKKIPNSPQKVKQEQPNNSKNVLHNTKIEPKEEDETPSVGSHNPDDLTKIMSARVDLDALSKYAKRKK